MSWLGLIARRLTLVVRTEGLRGVLGWIRENVDSEFVYWRFARGLEESQTGVPATVRPGNELILERGDLRQFKQWRDLQPAQSLPAWFWMDVERGLDLFYLAWYGPRMAHICWVVRPGQSTSVPGWQLAAGEAELRSAYTFPEFRGLGVWRLMVAFMTEDLRVEGYRTLYAHVAPENRASWGPLVRAGFRCVATVRVQKHWGRVRVVEQFSKGETGRAILNAQR